MLSICTTADCLSGWCPGCAAKITNTGGLYVASAALNRYCWICRVSKGITGCKRSQSSVHDCSAEA